MGQNEIDNIMSQHKNSPFASNDWLDAFDVKYINFVERDERFCCCLSLCRFCLFRHILHIYLCNFNSFVGEKCETCHSCHSFVDLTTTLTSYPYLVRSICRMHFSNATSTAVKPSKYDFPENIMALYAICRKRILLENNFTWMNLHLHNLRRDTTDWFNCFSRIRLSHPKCFKCWEFGAFIQLYLLIFKTLWIFVDKENEIHLILMKLQHDFYCNCTALAVMFRLLTNQTLFCCI